MSDFRKLLVWQKAHRFALRADSLSRTFQRRKPGLANQLTRCADAVPAAIAEGRGRDSDVDFARYCTVGIGEITEAENHLQRAFDGDLISEDDHTGHTADAVEIRRMLIGLRRRLRGEPRKRPAEEPKPVELPAPPEEPTQ